MNLAVLAVDEVEAHRIHCSILERAAQIASRLGCGAAARLASPPVTYADAELLRLRRELEEISAFADASRNTGWVLCDLAAAPVDEPVQVLELPEGGLWVGAVRGFELHGTNDVRRIAECICGHGHEPARRVPLPTLFVPLVESAARAEVLDLYESHT